MSHHVIDERSLAFDTLIAQKLERDSSLIDIARENIKHWLASCSAAARPALLEWQDILAAGPNTKANVLRILTGTDERSRRLRQSSPFCGPQIIGQAERGALLARHKI